MNLPVRTLPVLQQWDCHSCTDCCRAPLRVLLSAEDLRKLDAQGWHEHPEFREIAIVERGGLLRQERWLAQRADGRCVFLTEEGRCRIHEDFGATAKPLACRAFPFQLVPLQREVRVAVRASCPSAAANRGRNLSAHLGEIRKLAEALVPAGTIAAPRLVGTGRGDWAKARIVGDALERIVLDNGFPLVRRLVHGLGICEVLRGIRADSCGDEEIRDHLGVAGPVIPVAAEAIFDERRPPRRAGAVLFRQSAGDYLRPLGGLGPQRHWRSRWRLFRAALVFVRGSGALPRLDAALPAATFADLEGPLGKLEAEVTAPIDRFFETTVAGWRYCGAGRCGWSIVNGFGALALAYAVALWTLRWLAHGRQPTPEDSVRLVGWLDRAHWSPPLCGLRHRRRVATLFTLGELPRLIAWYAR